MKDLFRIKFWGVRGSIPTPGKETIKYGGNTPCVEVRCGNTIIILDGGSGIRLLGLELSKEAPVEAHLLFSHLHWDHIQGFPFFVPLFNPENTFYLYAEKKLNSTFKQLMAGQMMYPHFPVSFDDLNAKIHFTELNSSDSFNIDDVTISCAPCNHPDGCVSFKLSYRDRTIVYATDTEHYDKPDEILLKHADGADYLIYDATYTDDEYYGRIGMPKIGWGHSTWQEGVKLAKLAAVKNLILFHHDPTHNDNQIDEILKAAQKRFKNTIAAYEGLVIDV